jgi:hypothetical protein
MAKGKYYTPEFKEQAVKMVVGLDCSYDLLHALQGQCFRLDAHPDGRGQHGRAADRRQV